MLVVVIQDLNVHSDDTLNLVRHLSSHHCPPDMGPKMYAANGVKITFRFPCKYMTIRHATEGGFRYNTVALRHVRCGEHYVRRFTAWIPYGQVQ